MKRLIVCVLAFIFAAQAVKAADKFEKYVENAFSSGIILGDENGEFLSEKTATRAEFATIAVRFLGLSGGVNIFSDVEDSDWFSKNLAAASLHGMLAGYENGQARPYEPIKCEDAIAMLGRYYDAKIEGAFWPGVSEYAGEYFAYAVKNELFQVDGYIEPKHLITKGEILALMYEYSRLENEKIHFLKGYPKISENSIFSNISINIKTNIPCDIYYDIKPSGEQAIEIDELLCSVSEADKEGTAHINADINQSYDIYLKAVSKDGAQSRMAVCKNVRPFAFSSGSGTPENPYIIYNQTQLLSISQYPDKTYRLGADIRLEGEWTPIESFSGYLDGAGYKISGLKITEQITDAGLIAVLDVGDVYNLAVDAEISAKMNAGIIAGRNEGGTIDGCTVSGNVLAKTNNAGGICGINRGRVKNCLSAVYSASADSFAGGICGQNYQLIEACISAAEAVVSQMCAGGISGTNTSGEITACIAANMTVYSSMTYNGGKITINKQGGKTKNNYSYDAMITNASFEEASEYSQNGYEVAWDTLCDEQLYKKLEWNSKKWKKAENGYRLLVPAQSKEPVLEPGLTMYMPKPIETARELAAIDENDSAHYILTKDITLNAPWKTICQKNGFSGTLDGNGYAIKGLNLKGDLGLFSNITGGTVKNLNIIDAVSSPSGGGAILTACNYGYIQNCNISGRISAKRAGVLGAVTAENYGEIKNCTVRVDISNNDNNSTTGGICGENNGVVTGSSYYGKMTSKGDNAVFGGICGYVTDAYISECFANAEISLKSNFIYAGGICGVASGAQVYKCASSGKITSSGKMAYSGGICGAAEQSALYSCFSLSGMHNSAKSSYSGGICGINTGAQIQNSYAGGSIVAVGTGNVYAGGICAYAESGFVTQSVALNPSLNSTGGCGAIVGGYAQSEISGNFVCERMLVNSSRVISQAGGQIKPLDTLKTEDFYFKALAKGGALGWENEGSDIWTFENASSYKLPILTNVSGMETLIMPTYR